MKVQMPLIDVMVATACQLKCVACTNGMGIVKQEIFPYDQIVADVEHASRILHADVAVLLGGEPLVHPHLVPLMRTVKRSGITEKVRVLTNGMRLHRMRDEFWRELQDLKISIYPGKTPAANVQLAFAKADEHGFDLSFYDVAGDPFKAVHTMEPRSDESAQRTYDGCWYRHNTRKLEQGFFWRCCTSPHITKTILRKPAKTAALPLDGLTYAQLREFLDRPKFVEACRRCHGNNGPPVGQWTEERDKSRWLEASQR